MYRYQDKSYDHALDWAIKNSLKIHSIEKEKEKRKAYATKLKKEKFNKILEERNANATYDTINYRLFKKLYGKLNDFQIDIFLDCIRRNSAGLSLPLGSGKTLISLALSLYFTSQSLKPILVVVPKSLVSNWQTEIKKFLGEELKYEVVHRSVIKNIGIWKPNSETRIILTTVDVLAGIYKEFNIDTLFIDRRYNHATQSYFNHYRVPTKPFLDHIIGGGLFFSTDWGCFITDEVQKFTNIDTYWCKALGALCSKHRWLLSGTMFDEPKTERILGYHMILNYTGVPRNLPDTNLLLKDNIKFKGLARTLVSRESNKAFKPPKVNEHIISHKLDHEEEQIYMMMKDILVAVQKKAEDAKALDDTDAVKKFSSYKLVMIMYLRQVLVCPLLPLSSIAINVCDLKKRSELSDIIMNEINALGISDWLKYEESVKSSRIKKTIECLDKNWEKVIIFASFASYLDILQYYLKDRKRPVFRMLSKMSSKARGKLIEDFSKSKDGILLLTYQLGAEGLNLQFASKIFLTDFWWNASKTQQAIGRIFRFGQVSDTIDVYYFTGNTGIEKILFEKQKAKLDVLKELQTGVVKTKIPTINMKQIIKMIELADNKKLLKNVDYFKK